MDELEKQFRKNVRKYRAAKAQKDRIDSEIADLKQQIVDYMSAQESTIEQGPDFVVKLSARKRFMYDSSVLDELFGSDAAKYKKASESLVLTVK